MNSRSLMLVCVLAFGIGYYAGNQQQTASKPDRPVLRLMARVAKSFLWVALVAEKPPTGPQPDHRLAQHAIGDDGYPLVDNARGW